MIKCLICNNNEFDKIEVKLSSTGGKININICSQCGFARREMDKKGGILAEQLSVSSTHSVNPELREIHWPHRDALVAASIEKIAGKSGKMLDVGCSNGRLLASLSDGWQKFGIELCPVTAEAARKFSGAQVFCGPVEEYNSSEKFDFVSSCAVIEHLEDPVTFIRQISELLKPGGTLLVMTGDRSSSVACEMKDTWPLYKSRDHFSYFSAKSLRMLLASNGFEIIKEQWRFMYTSNRPDSFVRRKYEKIKEILGFIDKPVYDHYYCFAQKSKFI
jgi:SAM-dependent methyltransferase